MEPHLPLGFLRLSGPSHRGVERGVAEGEHSGRCDRAAGERSHHTVEERTFRLRAPDAAIQFERHQRVEPEPEVLRCGLRQAAAEQRRGDQEQHQIATCEARKVERRPPRS